jgi:phosphocarrier protein HPr
VQEATLTIINKLGLHARAASRFVAVSGRFGSSIRVRKDADWVDGKSIMAVMMLAAGKDSVLQVTAEGEDEAEALTALRELVDDYFGEGG